MATKGNGKSRGPVPITIDDVGGIHHAELTLRPGVNELTGANGAGKTSAVQAIRRVFGDRVPLEKRDGAAAGRITAPGIVVNIRHQVKPTGEAELEIADPGPVTRLIDPGIKGSDEAAIERVYALAEMIEPAFDVADLDQLAADPEVAKELRSEFAESAFRTLAKATDRAHKILHRHARAAEEVARGAAAEATVAEATAAEALEKAGGPDALVATPLAEAESGERAAIQAVGAARAARETRVALEKQQAEARAKVGEKPDPTRFDADIEARRGAVAAHERRVAELRGQIEREEALMQGTKHDLNALIEGQRQEAARLEEHRSLVDVLQRPVTGPTEDEIGELEAKATAATELRRAAAVSADVRSLAERSLAARAKRDAAADRAADLRDKAKTVFDRMADLEAMAERSGRLTVIAGRLHVRDENGNLHDFELRRSEGQRIDAVLEVAAQIYGPGSVVALDDRYWLALDMERRREFAALAERHGLYVISCRPSEGELAVRHLPADATETAAAEVLA